MTLPWRIVEADAEAVRHLGTSLDIPEAIAHLLVSRGLADPTSAERFLRKSMSDLVGPFDLSGMKQAAERIVSAVRNQERILVHGDFDADGITSAALLSLFLKEIGADVLPFVPNRLIEGHGISSRAMELCIREGVKLVITCDCGSSNAAEIRTLLSKGVDTIVTDHHQVPEGFPKEAILVNPQASARAAELGDLSGVGVAFMVAGAVRSQMREAGLFSSRPEPDLREYLDIVALGTLADMAALVGQNRILVARGLQQLARSNRKGIRTMRDSCGIKSGVDLNVTDVGFRLAPRINAAARLGHSEEALQLLMTDEGAEAERLSRSLEEWNLDRRARQETMLRIASIDAERQIQEGRKLIFVSSPDFHSGIVGLVAQKLASTYGVPAFVFALEGEVARGSGRSRSGGNLVAALESCRDLLAGYGGHRDACGCTTSRNHLSQVQKRLGEALGQQGVYASREVTIDATLRLGQVNSKVLVSLEQLGPFGMGNPEPVFFSKARVLGQAKEVGRGHVRVSLGDDGAAPMPAVGFGMWDSVRQVLSGDVDVAYTPERNEWNGRQEVQLRLKAVRSV